MTLTPAELARYSRHLSLSGFGMNGQEKLKAAKVLVIGAGGLGSPALLYLAAAGVGTLGIAEFDRVDVSNLQRQILFDAQQVGHGKAEAAHARLHALNPHIQINVHAEQLDAGNVLDMVREYDVVLDGTDRFAVRYLINDVCVLLKKPLVSAAIHRFEGQAFTYVPQQGPCYRCLFPEPPQDGAVPNCAEAGVLGVLPGVMGTLQATEAIKLITGIGEPLIGRLLTYDALDMRFGEFQFAANPACAVCGIQPSITQPQDMATVCASEIVTERIAWQMIDAEALQDLLQSKAATVLIDVREPYEFAAGHLPHALNIPLADLSQRLADLPQTQPWILMCRSGSRSAQACALIAQQLPNVEIANLEGGLMAWRQTINTDLVVV